MLFDDKKAFRRDHNTSAKFIECQEDIKFKIMNLFKKAVSKGDARVEILGLKLF